MKKTIIVLILHLVITSFLFATVPDVLEGQFTGTWYVEWEIGGQKVEDQIWVVTDSGEMTSYTINGRKTWEYSWWKDTKNVYIFKAKEKERYWTWYTYIIDENHLRMRNYLDSTDIMELYKISDSQEGFPDSIEPKK